MMTGSGIAPANSSVRIFTAIQYYLKRDAAIAVIEKKSGDLR
jgi:hypothetical protein